MLILLGGPDRVGKSTLAAQLSEITDFPVKHHSEPDPRGKTIFDSYRRDLLEGGDQIWDRSYLCTYILERFRNHNHDHLAEITDFELKLSKIHQVIHVGVTRPWHWSAPLHVEEIKGGHDLPVSDWFIRDMLMCRQNEHHFYTDEMVNFYQFVTMFPSFMVEPAWTASDVFENISAISKDGRPRFF